MIFFFKKYFSIKVSEYLSTYSSYESLQLKNTKKHDQRLRKLSKKTLTLVESSKGKINFSPSPPGDFATAD